MNLDNATEKELEFLGKLSKKSLNWGVFFKSSHQGYQLLINCTDKDHAMAIANPERGHKVMMFEVKTLDDATAKEWERLTSKHS